MFLFWLQVNNSRERYLKISVPTTSMIMPGNLKEHSDIIRKKKIELDKLFVIHELSFKEKLVRKYGSPILNNIPTKGRYILTNIIKRIRNPSMKLKLNYPLDYPECRILANELKGKNLKPWWNKKAVVCICHDVDNIEGVRFVQEMSKIDEEFEVMTTFNFLTHDNYKLDGKTIESLKERGFEIGLQGYTHDQGFAYRSKKKINKLINLSLNEIKRYAKDVKGYRSPALSLSEALFEALKENQLVYDSTLQISSPFYNSVRLPYPIYIEKYNLWEIALMVQDDNYFRDTKTDEKTILSSIRRFIEEVLILNGVFVINMHPHLMSKRKIFYRKFLKLIKEFKDIKTVTMGEVAEYARDHTANC